MIINFLKFLQFEKRYSEHTLKAYREDLNQLLLFLESTFEINDLSKAEHSYLRSWVVDLMERSITPRSINRKIATLKSFYKFLLAREFITKNPASRLRPLKTDKPLPTFFREGEMTTLLDQIEYPDGFAGTRDKLLLEILYATGIRLSELIGIKDTDIDHHEQLVKVLGKRNKERIVPISDSIVKLINQYQQLRNRHLENCNTPYLLVTDSGDQIYPMMVYRIVKKYAGAVSTQDKKSPHVLRHTFATHLLNKGADLNAVKDLLGHTSLAATQVYTHNSLEKLKSTFDQAHPKA
ncbi:MAG: tyrosine-type recombinase/integrase [Cyclobacteriaceae bacterium]|nr:tyrosine-type recombinase/integrase [Cyclobacteriaceae bacterium HetDA_MAG_MS6]